MSIQVTLPAGKYYIGDDCHVLRTRTYAELNKQLRWGERGSCLLKHEYEFNHKKFAIAHTYGGDGLYTDNHGKIYHVDSGCISIIPFDLCDNIVKENRIYDFNSDVIFQVKDGVFMISGIIEDREYPTKIAIDTKHNAPQRTRKTYKK